MLNSDKHALSSEAPTTHDAYLSHVPREINGYKTVKHISSLFKIVLEDLENQPRTRSNTESLATLTHEVRNAWESASRLMNTLDKVPDESGFIIPMLVIDKDFELLKTLAERCTGLGTQVLSQIGEHVSASQVLETIGEECQKLYKNCHEFIADTTDGIVFKPSVALGLYTQAIIKKLLLDSPLITATYVALSALTRPHSEQIDAIEVTYVQAGWNRTTYKVDVSFADSRRITFAIKLCMNSGTCDFEQMISHLVSVHLEHQNPYFGRTNDGRTLLSGTYFDGKTFTHELLKWKSGGYNPTDWFATQSSVIECAVNTWCRMGNCFIADAYPDQFVITEPHGVAITTFLVDKGRFRLKAGAPTLKLEAVSPNASLIIFDADDNPLTGVSSNYAKRIADYIAQWFEPITEKQLILRLFDQLSPYNNEHLTDIEQDRFESFNVDSLAIVAGVEKALTKNVAVKFWNQYLADRVPSDEIVSDRRIRDLSIA